MFHIKLLVCGVIIELQLALILFWADQQVSYKYLCCLDDHKHRHFPLYVCFNSAAARGQNMLTVRIYTSFLLFYIKLLTQ